MKFPYGTADFHAIRTEGYYYADRTERIRALEDNAARAQGHELYLLIDEYDNFANELMQRRRADYDALVSGEGLLKTVFKAVESLASGAGIDRVFITGVSPVVLADISSGYNVSEDISLDARFIDLCGFTEAEVAAVLDQLTAEYGHDRDSINPH